MTQRLTKSLNMVISLLILATMLIGVIQIPTSAAAQTNLQQNDLRIDYSDETGKASFIGVDPGKSYQLEGVFLQGIAPADRPMLYLHHFGEMLGLRDPGRELQQQFSRAHEGRSTTRYQQMYEGIPIMAGELIVNLDARGSLLSISGEVSPDLSLSTTPEVAAEDAQSTALHAIAKVYNLDAAELTTTEPELWVFDERLLQPSTRPAELVWRMDVVAVDGLRPIRELVLVNAARGGISLHFNQIDTSWGAIQDEPPETPAPTPTPMVEPTESVTPEPAPTAIVPAPTASPRLPEESDDGRKEPPVEWGEGNEYYVKPGGDDGLDCDTPATACETIGAAIGKAASGDTIYIASGTYTGSGEYVVSFDKNLLLSGGWETDFSAQTGFSTIDGEDTRKGVGVGGGRTAELAYIRIQNGNAAGSGNTGGGIVNSGDLTLHHCIVTENNADFNGGGIYQTGTLVIEYSELSNNHSGDTGGAMIVVGGTVELRNVTISGNSSDINAGGIFNAGALTLNNVTFANNTTTGNGGGLISGGGGSVTMSNTVLADNSAGTGPDCAAPTAITTLGYNLIEVSTGCNFTPATGDITGVDPVLVTLEGSPAYHLFGSGSALTDAGNPATPGSGSGACETEDQRGTARPLDGDDNGSSLCDIGAVEITPTVPDSIEAYAGTPQQTDLLTTFDDPLQARVLDNYGSPMEGETVTFTAPATDASGTFLDSGTHETTAVTASDGIATAADFTANDVEGAYIVEAAVSGVATPAEFSLENFEVFAVSVDVNAGSGQIAEVSTTFSTQLQALVQDQFGSPLEGETVTFTAPANGASGTFADSMTNETTAVTDSEGLATAADFTANGEMGSYIVEASVVGVGTPAEFSLENYISTPSSIDIFAGSGQATEILTTFATPLEVLVENQYGDPFEGASVTFTAPASGASGTFAASGTNETSVLTGADGHATASAFTANGDAGLYIVEASVDGESLSVDFYLENFIMVLTSVEEVAGSHQHAEPLAMFTLPFQVIVKDQYGNPVAGVTVTFTAPASGASGNFADSLTNETTAITNASGIATAAEFTANDQEGIYVALAAVAGIPDPVEFTLANFISTAWYVSIDGYDGYDCRSPVTACATIDEPLDRAGFIDGDSILVTASTFTRSGTYPVLSLHGEKEALVRGGWDETFTSQDGYTILDGNNTRSILYSHSTTITFERFIMQNSGNNGSFPGSSISIYFNSHLTLKDCIVRNNNGRGIYNQTNLYLINTLIHNNQTSEPGGGIYNYYSSYVLMEGSAIFNNTASIGGGIYTESSTSNDIYLNNSTIAGNTASQGGGIVFSGDLSLNNASIVKNVASDNSGGLLIRSNGNLSIQNSLIAENSAPTSPDCSGSFISIGYNLIGSTTGCSITSASGDILDVDAHLGSLVTIGGYVPLLSTSPAIDGGNPGGCTNHEGDPIVIDQRGVTRTGTCDIGAYEYLLAGSPNGIQTNTGDNQRAILNTTYQVNLEAFVHDSSGSPVEGITVTFIAPGSGPSGTFIDTATNSTTAVSGVDGIATAADFVANDQLGTYDVLATIPGVADPAIFVLTNRNPFWYVTEDGNDLNDCESPETSCATIIGAIGKFYFEPGDIVLVTDMVITSVSNYTVIDIDGLKDAEIRGGWDGTFTFQTGYTVLDAEGSRQGLRLENTSVSLERFIIENANPTVYQDGSGIRTNDEGNLTLIDCILRNNRSSDHGGGIYTTAELVLENTLIIDNYADLWGGGIFMGGNSVAVINNSAIVSNISLDGAGGIQSYSSNSMIINNSTIAGNHGWSGGGIKSNSEVYLHSSSIIDNIGIDSGGGVYLFDGGNLSTQNSIIADNTALKSPDCSGALTSGGYNLIGSTADCSFISSTGDVLDVDAQLGELVILQGFVPLLSGSPAIEGGNPAGCLDHEGSPIVIDQRGVTRTGTCDIGAYEYMFAGTQVGIQAIAGDDQRNPPGEIFTQKFGVFVHDEYGNPVEGITVTYTAPGSGPSGTFSDTLTNVTSAVTGEDGVATAATFTANSSQGFYSVTASIASPLLSTDFNMENKVWYVSPDGNNALDCRQVVSACATIEAVFDKQDFEYGDTVWVESGFYAGSIQLDKDARIFGGWNADFSTQSSHSIVDCTLGGSTGIYIDDRIQEINYFGVENCDPGILNSGWAITESLVMRENNNSYGGAIENQGYFVLRSSTVRDNSANNGGGIMNHINGLMVIENSFIQNNQNPSAYGEGGGIFNNGTLYLLNSTVSKNVAENAGGIYVHANSDRTVIINSTITNNIAYDELAGGVSGENEVTILNSIVAGNSAPDNPDCDGAYIQFEGYNIFGFPEGCSYTDDDIVSVEPLLVPQLVNGGPDVIYALMPRSPAIDAANPAAPGSGGDACLATDQRGVTRPLDGDENGTLICDIGAYELDPSDPPTIPDPGPGGARRTYTSRNTTWYPGVFLCDQTQLNCTDGANLHADRAHIHAGDTYAFYAAHYGRDSFDNEGGIIVSSVHVGSGYANAAWTGRQMIYGDAYGFPRADDVVAHELTHAVTQYTSHLFYYYQSGAINESFSDLWGEFVDLTNGEGNDDPGVRWLMGEDIAGYGAMRDMADPTAFGDPDRMTSPNYYTGSADLYDSSGDSGGVHTNSGVNSKAVYLMTDGDSFNGQTVTGLGIDKVAAIYYEVQTNLLTSGADYKDLYNALYQGCLNLIGGAEGIAAGDCMEVRKATLAVEMNQEPVLGYNPDVGLCDSPGSVPMALFADDIESGTANWAPGYESGGDQWSLTATWYATSGTHSLYGDDFYYGGNYPWPLTDSYVAMVVDVPLAGGSQPYLHFNHAFGFEQPDYDGGWLEYSTDGGSNWTDAGALYDEGMDYTGAINTAYGDGDNLHTGRDAFVGDSHGYVSSRYDLSSLAGQSVRFRWRMSTDSLYFDWGWWVDDVRIYTCRVMGDFDGDGEPDIGDYRPSNGRWYLKDLLGADYGLDGGISAPSDYDGDSKIEADRSYDDRWYLDDRFVESEEIIVEDDVTDFVEGANEFDSLETVIQAVEKLRTSEAGSSPAWRLIYTDALRMFLKPILPFLWLLLGANLQY